MFGSEGERIVLADAKRFVLQQRIQTRMPVRYIGANVRGFRWNKAGHLKTLVYGCGD